MDESGVLERIRDFYTPLNAKKNAEECSPSGSAGAMTAVAHPIDASNAAAPFCILLAGGGAAALLVAVERVLGRLPRRRESGGSERAALRRCAGVLRAHCLGDKERLDMLELLLDERKKEKQNASKTISDISVSANGGMSMDYAGITDIITQDLEMAPSSAASRLSSAHTGTPLPSSAKTSVLSV